MQDFCTHISMLYLPFLVFDQFGTVSHCYYRFAVIRRYWRDFKLRPELCFSGHSCLNLPSGSCYHDPYCSVCVQYSCWSFCMPQLFIVRLCSSVLFIGALFPLFAGHILMPAFTGGFVPPLYGTLFPVYVLLGKF